MEKRVIIAVLFLTTVHGVGAVHFPYESAIKSDQWIYDFFSSFLDEFEKEIRLASKGENCISPVKKLELVKEEIELYRMMGVESNASILINEFLEFSRALEDLCEAQKVIKIEKGVAIAKMRSSVLEMRALLDQIDSIVLYNGTAELLFDTSKVRDAIAELEKLLDFYRSQIGLEGLWVFVSKSEPVLFEKVWIRIYAVNVTPTDLFIDGRVFDARDVFYSFDKIGKHFVYAEGLRGSEIVRSNVVEVEVKKIPVYINLMSNSPKIGEKAEVNGYIIDYFESKLSVPLKIKIDDQEFLLNSSHGFFQFSFSRDYECKVRVSVVYEGNATHERAIANITVLFSRLPVWIKIRAEKERIFPWEPAILHVTASEQLPIKVFFNDKAVDLFGKNFKFDVKLNPGKYRVYAYFPGDEIRREAKSNEITIIVESLTVPVAPVKFDHLLILLLSLLISSSAFLILKKRRNKKSLLGCGTTEEERENGKTESTDFEGSSISDAYSKLFMILTEKFGLSKSLTPRELLKKLEGTEFFEKLSEITEIHEKNVYASQVVGEVEVEKFFKLLRDLIGRL